MTVAPIDDARLAEVRARFDAIPAAEPESLTGHVKGLLARLDAQTAALEAQGRALAEAGWRPISTHKIDAIKGPYSPHVLCGHAEKQWRRFGRYDLTLKRWYYSGTDERSQWAQVEGDEPTHWMPIPELFESSGRNLADATPSNSPSSKDQEIAGLRRACECALGHLTGNMDGDWSHGDPVEMLRAALSPLDGEAGR